MQGDANNRQEMNDWGQV